MQIKNKVFEEMGLQLEGATVTLFVASKTNPGLKRLDLSGLTPEQRSEKFKELAIDAKEKNLVAVIEKGNSIYALISPQLAERVIQQGLSINGKKVEGVKTLTEEQSDRLSAIGEAFEEYVRLNPEEEVKEDSKDDSKNSERSRQNRSNYQNYRKQYFASSSLLEDTISIDYLILKMSNLPEKAKFAFLRKMHEMQIEIDKRKKEEAKEKDAKIQENKHIDLKKRILTEEVVKESISDHDDRLDNVSKIKKRK